MHSLVKTFNQLFYNIAVPTCVQRTYFIWDWPSSKFSLIHCFRWPAIQLNHFQNHYTVKFSSTSFIPSITFTVKTLTAETQTLLTFLAIPKCLCIMLYYTVICSVEHKKYYNYREIYTIILLCSKNRTTTHTYNTALRSHSYIHNTLTEALHFKTLSLDNNGSNSYSTSFPIIIVHVLEQTEQAPKSW